MHARVVTFQGSPDRMQQELRDRFRERVLPALQQQPGFQRVFVLLDRARGKVLGISLWESEAAAEAAMRVMEPIRAESAEALGAGAPTGEAYEVLYSG